MATTRKTDASLYRFDDVVVDRNNFRIQKGEQTRTLPPRAFDLLIYLIMHRHRVIEKQELFEQVWQETFVTDNALTKVIKDLRRTLGDDADAPRYIETVPKRGYRFIAEVTTPEETGTEAQQTTADTSQKPATIIQPEPAILLPPEAARPDLPRQAGRGFRLGGNKLLAVAILFAIVVVAIFVIWKNLTRPRQVETTTVLRTLQITNWTGLDLNPVLSPDGNSLAYSSDHNGSFEIYVKPLTPGAREIQLTAEGNQNFEPAWSADGKLIAYYSKNRGGIWIIPASGGTAKQLTEFGSCPAWSPDGSVIAFQSYPLTDLGATSVGALPPSTLWTVPSQGGDPAPITQVGNPVGGHGAPSWSPDGKRIVFVAFDGYTAEIWTVSATGTDLRQVTHRREWVYDPIFSPDGEQIYYGGVSEPGNFVLYKLQVSPTSGNAISEPLEVANTGLARIKHLAISRDGRKLVYSAPTMKGSIAAVPISPNTNEATGVAAPLTQDTSYRKSLPRISPDGRKIAYTEFRGGANQDIWVMDADGKNPAQLTTDPAIDWSPSWFPDNDRIAFLSNRQGKSRIWSVSLKSGREKILVDQDQDISWPVLSPDGKQVVFNSTKSGTINVWTAAVEGGQPVQLTFDNETMGWACWSPDGKLLALQMKRGDDTHMMVMPSSGGTPTQLTFDRGQSWPHGWSPDGDKVVFAGFRNGYWNVWWVSRSTKKEKQVTNYTKLNAYVRYPSWSPLGNQIVYEYTEVTGNIWMMELK